MLSVHFINLNVLPAYFWICIGVRHDTAKVLKQERLGKKYKWESELNCMSDLDAGAVGEEGLWALRVVKWPVAHTPPRSPNGEAAAVEQVARTVAVLGCFIDYLERDQSD